jgi:hypothetical protein
VDFALIENGYTVGIVAHGMTSGGTVTEGETITYTPTVTDEAVTQFAALSKDEGYHHMVGDEDGQVVLHGMLTATMPTKLGGTSTSSRTRWSQSSRDRFTPASRSPVRRLARRSNSGSRTEIAVSFTCTTADDAIVLRGHSEGVVMG